MNERVLTVKGIGNAAAKPDLIIVNMALNTVAPEYAQSTERAADEIESIRQALISVGYKKESLKTTDFNISAEYENHKDRNGDYRRRFTGYKCFHALKLEFDLDMNRLGATLAAIFACGSAPELQIIFSVKDRNAVSAELLENAIANAKEKAVVLSKAAAVRLGAIQRIDYNWGELPSVPS